MIPRVLSACTVLCRTLNMCLWQVSLAGDSGSLIWSPPVTFSGAPNFDVDNSFDGGYLGWFIPPLPGENFVQGLFAPLHA